MVPEPQPLFARQSLLDYLGNRRAAMMQEIQPLDLNALTANEPALRQHLEQKYQLQPLQLGTDIDPIEITDTFLNLRGTAEGALWGNPSRVPARRIVYAIPFQGTHELFHCTPSTFCGTAPMFIVTETELRAVICAPTNKDAVEIRRQLDHELDYVRKHIAWMAGDVQRYAAATPSYIERCIADRKKELADKAAFNTALGLKARQNDDPAPAKADTPPPVPRNPTPDLSPPSSDLRLPPEASSKADTPPSSVLRPQSSDFTRILQRILRSARLIERYPKTWRKADENTLRDIVMTVISAEYPIVNGEANSGDGRPDILVQDGEGRTLFIGECKKWKGRENLARGLKQLLGYANWRDCHLGLILFVTGSIAYAPRTIAEVFAEHPCYKRPLNEPQEDGIYRHLFCLPKDPCCKVEVAVVLLHVPGAPET